MSGDPCVTDLDTYVRVQKLLTTSDGMGGQTAIDFQAGTDQTADDAKWVEWFGFWAEVKWAEASQMVDAQRVQVGVYAKMVANWDARLTSNQRLILPDGKILALHSVTNRNQRSVWMDIKSQAGVAT